AIDQVLGQSWAWQLGLGRVLHKEKTLSALRSLWNYNFTFDVGLFLTNLPLHVKGRPLCLPGEGGMIMVTNPLQEPEPYGGKHWTEIYFNECMSGFEHQVASHMIAEGMVHEGLAVTRAIHDRYSAEKRNQYNEVECSDNYARAIAEGLQEALVEHAIPASAITELRHGTTVGSNAILEQKGARIGLIGTKGFRDILQILFL
ncbi:MAG: hydantoinase/oxoprolinase N-terminal domain-containing protein, partial [Chloroflexota bacterium]